MRTAAQPGPEEVAAHRYYTHTLAFIAFGAALMRTSGQWSTIMALVLAVI